MAGRPWLSFGFFVPMLAALLLVIAVSCGGGATSTAAPQPESVAPAAEPAAEPEAMEETKDTGEAAEVQVAPTATPVPVAAATATAVPEAVSAAAEPFGTLRTSFGDMPAYGPHTRYRPGVSVPHLMIAHEGLFTFDKDSILRGQMVKEWSVAPDNRTWTFKLHEGIQFHGGWGEVTPEDIFYSVREVGADDSTCGCAQTQAMFSNPDGYWIALDNYTLELDTVTPAADLLNWLDFPGSGSAWIFSKKQWDTLSETQTVDEAIPQLVGTGPWEMEEIRLGEVWKFKAVPDHWRKTPEFAEAHILTIPEESTALANFLTGKLDVWSAAPDSLPKVAELETTKFMSMKGAGELVLFIWQNGYTYVGTDKQWPGYNPDDPWTASDTDLDSEGWERARKVREAIGLAIDREKIIDELLHGDGETALAFGWQSRKSQWLEGWEWPYDPERSRQLLKEAGYEDGFDMDVSVGATRVASVAQLTCEAIAVMLQDVGINAILRNVPTSVLYPGYKARTQQGITCQHVNTGAVEPFSRAAVCYTPGNLWGCGWDHPKFTELMKKASETFDFDKRWAIQLEMGQFMRDNALSIGVYGQNQVFPLGPKLDSWEEHLSMGMPGAITALEYAPHRK